jgi:nucleotide-binding universal stress UspA family protein
MKILLAVDGSESSDAAVDEIAVRPWPAGTELTILTVIEPPPAAPMAETWTLPGDYIDQWEQAGEERARTVVDAAARRIADSHKEGLTVQTRIAKGYPREVILDEAQKGMTDLIVLGSHGYRGLKRLWLGSVSQAVASHADCSVEIVRKRKRS